MRVINPKKNSTAGRRFFLASALFLSVFLVAFVLVRSAPTRPVGPRVDVRPDFTSLLPAGAAPGTSLEIFEAPANAYIVAFRDGATVEAGLVAWNRLASAYRLTSTVALATPDGTLDSVSKFDFVPLGGGGPGIIVAYGGHGGAYTEGVMLLTREGDALRIVERSDADGKMKPAFFLDGASVKNGIGFRLEDANGDGKKEALVTSRATDDSGKDDIAISAFQWSDGAFRYDADLSWALTMSGRVFPSPGDEVPADEGGTSG